MRIHLIAVGKRMPAWINEGYGEYAKRLPPECSLNLVEIQPGQRGKNPDIARAIQEEGQRMQEAIPKGAQCLALDQSGQSLSSEALAKKLGGWLADGRDLALLVGGPDGLASELLQHPRWSLSPLTLPHPLVRVLVAEQLYRAWSQLHNHPYHRA